MTRGGSFTPLRIRERGPERGAALEDPQESGRGGGGAMSAWGGGQGCQHGDGG